MWKLGLAGRWRGIVIFIKHVKNPETLRAMWKRKGDHFALFGGTAYCRHAEVRALMAREPEKVAGFCGPFDDTAAFFSAGYLPYLQKNANHAERRAHVIASSERARGRLDELDALLREGVETEAALATFLFRAFASINLTQAELRDLMFLRKWAPLLAILPRGFRNLLLKGKIREVQRIRAHFLDRLAAAGVPFADTYLEVLWFNSGTLGHYPALALDALRKDPALRAAVDAECALPPLQRRRTRALVMEVIRLKPKISSVNYLEQGEVKLAVIPCAGIDPERYDRPREIDLERNHDDAVWFAAPSPNRSCAGLALAPEMMACVVAHGARSAGVS
jgi:hypothetical protein